MNVYVASSWRNALQPAVVAKLRELGHEVYDFRHPGPGDDGFSWKEVDGGWQSWTPERFREALKHPRAVRSFANDSGAVRAADATLLVLPCGRSAHLELGYAVGRGQRTAVLMLEQNEPELMYSWCDVLTSWGELEAWAESLKVERSPCGSCAACDEERFAGWVRRIDAGLPTEDDGEPFWPRLAGEEKTPREKLAAEILADMARRHPFGVAVRLGAVIESLAAHELEGDRDAAHDLADLVWDEQESQGLNGSSVTCAAWAARADARKATREGAAR